MTNTIHPPDGKKYQERKCDFCGTIFTSIWYYKEGKYKKTCSKKCNIQWRLLYNKRGKNHYAWKGDKVGLHALHRWIKKYKIRENICQCCKQNKAVDLANISGKYHRNINDFEWLCRKCHMMKDGRILELIKNKPKYTRINKKGTETSKYRGVSWSNQRDNWRMSFRLNNKTICRHYDSELEAAMAYNEEAKKKINDELLIDFPFNNIPMNIHGSLNH